MRLPLKYFLQNVQNQLDRKLEPANLTMSTSHSSTVADTYHNSVDCAMKTLRSEGPFGFYKGFIPNWMRIGPHTIITFFIFEQLRRVVGISPI